MSPHPKPSPTLSWDEHYSGSTSKSGGGSPVDGRGSIKYWALSADSGGGVLAIGRQSFEDPINIGAGAESGHGNGAEGRL